jgi:hypothetical protein
MKLAVLALLGVLLASPAYAQTEARSPKVNGYGALENGDARSPKVNGYGALENGDARSPKVNGYGVLHGIQAQSPKLIAYGVFTACTAVPKLIGYGVLENAELILRELLPIPRPAYAQWWPLMGGGGTGGAGPCR